MLIGIGVYGLCGVNMMKFIIISNRVVWMEGYIIVMYIVVDSEFEIGL